MYFFHIINVTKLAILLVFRFNSEQTMLLSETLVYEIGKVHGCVLEVR